MQAQGVIQSAIPNVVIAAYVEGSGDGGVVKEVCHPPDEMEVASNMDGAPPVGNAEVCVKDADVEGCGDVGVGIDVREAGQAKDAMKEMMVRMATVLQLSRTRR